VAGKLILEVNATGYGKALTAKGLLWEKGVCSMCVCRVEGTV
jgi:homoaconitase/3-isopropylmalate dehydratase large subunit